MKSSAVFLKHIFKELEFLAKETENLDFQAFLKDERLTRACARSLEIIGEAVKNLDSAFKAQHEHVDWKKIAGLRDKIIHHYFGVNWDIVWDVLTTKLPEFKSQVTRMLHESEFKR